MPRTAYLKFNEPHEGPMTFGSLFSGVEGFGLGFERAGMKCVWQVERDRDCLSVLARHFPDVVRVNDVNRFRAMVEPRNATKFGAGSDIVRPDWIIGGFPCQDVSVAGRRAGLAGSRSGLWHVFRRILGVIRPFGVCIENVPGLLSSNGGRDMGIVLAALGKLGYGWAFRVLDAQWFGTPQRRRRVFIVGCLGDSRRAAEILFERDCLPWDSPPSREAWQGTADRPASCLKSSGKFDHTGDESKLVASTVTTLAAAAFARGDGSENLITHTLRGEGFDASEDGTGRGTPIVPVAFQSKQSSTSDSPSFDNVSPTLDVAKGGGMAVAFQCHGSNVGPMGTLRSGNGNESGGVQFTMAFAQNQRDEVRNLNDVAGSLAAEPGMKQQTFVAFQERGRPEGRTVETQVDVAYSLNAPNGGGRRHENNIAGGLGVRRLTPRECERLQGFPDDWTQLAADGSEIADSPRYRMLGNAVNVAVSRWIGERIVMTEAVA